MQRVPRANGLCGVGRVAINDLSLMGPLNALELVSRGKLDIEAGLVHNDGTIRIADQTRFSGPPANTTASRSAAAPPSMAISCCNG